MLLKLLLKHLRLLDVWLEAYISENIHERFVVDTLAPITLTFKNTCFQIKDLPEVNLVRIGYATRLLCLRR